MGYEIDDAGVVRVLDGIHGRLTDLTPALQVVASDLREFIDDRFRRSVDPAGRPWAPLAQVTIEKRRGTDATILVDTANLRNSVFTRARPDGIEFGAAASYATHHHFGTARMPKRRFLPVTDANQIESQGEAGELLEDIERMLANYIAGNGLTVSAA